MRWRPQFSLQTMFVLVTLICLYFGLWEVTKRLGVTKPFKVGDNFLEFSSQAVGPLVVRTEHSYFPGTLWPLMKNTRYELWLFGPRFTVREWREPYKERGQILPGPYYLEPPPES